MKHLLILFITMFIGANSSFGQESTTVVGTYDRFEDGIYYFIDEDGETHAFHDLVEEAMEAYDLMDEAFIGQLFSITFTSESDEDSEMEFNTITGLLRLE